MWTTYFSLGSPKGEGFFLLSERIEENVRGKREDPLGTDYFHTHTMADFIDLLDRRFLNYTKYRAEYQSNHGTAYRDFAEEALRKLNAIRMDPKIRGLFV